MALFNYATKEITLKVVYYGPGLSGKTTNLQHLHSILDPTKTGKLLSLATETDRTLFFDFLPIELGKIKDFSIRFQLYTVPGQVKYNATRKVVLKGADAVVFVADSQREMREANIESFANMKENLLSNNINPDDTSLVLQYNKRDLPDILSIDELNKDLNNTDQVYLEAEAINGRGVQETFQTITKLLIKDIARKHKLEIQPAAVPEESVVVVTETITEKPFEEERIPLKEPVSSFFPSQEPIVEEKISIEEPIFPPITLQEPTVEEEIPMEESTISLQELITPHSLAFEKPEEEKIILEEPVQPFIPLQEPVIEKEEWKEKEPEIKVGIDLQREVPMPSIEKLDKMAESLEEINQLLINVKATIKEFSDELKQLREEQKEIASIIRGIKISEAVERIKEREKKKKGWFGF